MVSKAQTMWVAGLLEGEGCFLIYWKTSTTGETYPAYRISCNMTDEDVLQRLSEWTGNVAKITGPYDLGNPKHKPFWRWHIHKRAYVQDLCEKILPYMGERRSAKIRELLATAEQYPPKRWKHGTRNGYDAHHCRCKPCRMAHNKHCRLMRAKRKLRK